MAIEQIKLELIHDNPYQARLTYHKKDIDELAHSIQTHGLLQVPPGRRKDGDIELGFGHLRKRAFAKLAKKDPEKFYKMPVDIRDLTDEQMALFALEENLKRAGLTPLDTARAVDLYLNSFLEKTEVEVAESLNMTKGNVSNMRRVLRLPEKLLEKIDEGIITFTQGRELLTLEGIPDAEELMSRALAGINTTGNKQYSKPNTVEGLQQSIHSVIENKFPPLDKEFVGYRYNLLFDTREAGCLKCDKCIITHPTKSQAAHYCTDEDCWKKKTEEHKAKAAAAAMAKMEEEVLKRAAANISQEQSEPAAPQYTLEKRGTSWIAIDGQGRIIAIDYDKKAAEDEAKGSFNAVATKVTPTPDEYLLNHTYRIIGKPEVRKSRNYIIPDVTAQDLATALKALELNPEDVESAKVWKSSGKVGTSGAVSAGWSKCTETLDDISQEMSEEPPDETCATAEELQEMEADATAKADESRRESANLERPVGELPCDTCLRGKTCDRSFFYADDDSGRLVCDQWQTGGSLEQELSRRIAAASAPAPDDLLERAKAAAGTRAEVLDLTDICTGNQGYNYSRQMKQGYALLSDELRWVDEPEECLERCTHGFHFAFDSKYPGEKEIFVCSDPKCLSQKKGAHTRKVNAEGLARKNAERKAIQEAIQGAGNRPRGLMLLVIYAQLKGSHVSTYHYGGIKAPEKWLWDKLSAGTKEGDRNINALMKRLDKLDEDELRQVLVGMMFYYLADHGDVGSYQVKTELPLRLMGVDIELNAKEEQSETTDKMVAELGR